MKTDTALQLQADTSLPAQAKKLIVAKRDITASRNKQHMKLQEVSHDGQFFSQPQTATYTAIIDRGHFQEVICNYTLRMLFINLITGQQYLHKENVLLVGGKYSSCLWIPIVNSFKSETSEVPTKQKEFQI